MWSDRWFSNRAENFLSVMCIDTHIVDFQWKFIEKRLVLDFNNQTESNFFVQSVVLGEWSTVYYSLWNIAPQWYWNFFHWVSFRLLGR